MTITIPEWVLWMLAVPAGLYSLFLAVLGVMILRGIGGRYK